MTQTSRQMLYGSPNTPFNASDDTNPRNFAYWADLGFSDMLLWVKMPGTNGGPPAGWAPLGGASNADYKYVTAQGAAHGVKVHLSAPMHGTYGTPTPAHPLPFNPDASGAQKDWLFDDTYWNGTVLVGAHTLGRWAKENGFAGVFFDEEISSSNDGWTYAGHNAAFPGHTQAQCEAAAVARGKSWMQVLLAEYPNIEYSNYAASTWPQGYSNYMRTKNAPIYSPSLQNFFYKGALSAPGYLHAYFLNADFYGGQYFPAAPIPLPYGGKTYDRWQWGTVQFDRDQTNKFWDTFLDPATDRSKVDIVPFIAVAQIESGQYPQYQTKPLSMVTDQIVPSIKQNINPGQRPVPLVGHYAYGAQAESFDYSPYRAALRDMVGVSASVSGAATFPVIADGVTSSGLLTVNLT